MNTAITPGAYRSQAYIDHLKGRRVAFVGNQTSEVHGAHTLDHLLSHGVNVVKIFGPEHGFRDMANDATPVIDKIDTATGLPVISLYGAIEKPTVEHIADVDVFVYDIQDIGARFYTYISTLSYIMEAAAENGKEVVILDRPNPNGHYIDGNILDMEFSTFVGRHPVPIVYGMTVGEYAQMVNGEGWLKGGIKCELTIIEVENYDHTMSYSLPVRPSPNMPDDATVNIYPSTCFFEGTCMSEGRGTDTPFRVFGHPQLSPTGFSYIPMPNDGAAEPRFKGIECHGLDLRNIPERLSRVNLEWVIWAYHNFPDKKRFFIPFFNNLAGGTTLKKQIIAGMTAEEIHETWKEGIEAFKEVRKKYLLYPDFE